MNECARACVRVCVRVMSAKSFAFDKCSLYFTPLKF